MFAHNSVALRNWNRPENNFMLTGFEPTAKCVHKPTLLLDNNIISRRTTTLDRRYCIYCKEKVATFFGGSAAKRDALIGN